MLHLVPAWMDHSHSDGVPLSVNTTPLRVHAERYITGRYRRGEITAKTLKAHRYTLGTLCDTYGNRAPSSFGPKAVDRWLETIGDRATATRRNYISRARAFGRHLLAEGIINRDPFAHVPPVRDARREPVTLTRPEVTRLHDVLPDLRAELIVEMMDGVGARCCEMSNFLVEDYDPTRGRTLLRGKNGNERTVTLPRHTQALIERYLAETGLTSGHLIRNRNHPERGIKPATFTYHLRQWMWKAGIKRRARDGRSAHALRRTCGSELMEATGDIRVVQAVLGHARIETTARYYLRPVALPRMAEAMAARTAYLAALTETDATETDEEDAA